MKEEDKMPYYLVLFTETEFCITSSEHLPAGLKDNMDKVKVFDSQHQAELHAYQTLTGGDFWDFGIIDFYGPNEIEIGRIYHRNKRKSS